MSPFEVFLTDSAVRDLERIDTYLSQGSLERANRFLNELEDIFESLEELPRRGTYPKELCVLGIKDFREIYLKSYRIIYRIFSKKVYVYLIADGRRDMQTLLSERLLEN